MHWKVKATVQTAIAALPSSLSYATYFWTQRLVGGLRLSDPTGRLQAGIDTWRRIEEHGVDPAGKTFFEVGTGTTPMVPMAYWLMGARGTVTVDLHRYLKRTLVREELEYLDAHHESLAVLFGPRLDRRRWDAVRALPKGSAFSLTRFLDLCGVSYHGPSNAAQTALPRASIDFHTSFTVLEHIPRDVIAGILAEGNRIVRDEGLFVHFVDYSDHFSHSDSGISAINFLQYSEGDWSRYAGNRYMYMNRLRHDDMLSLFCGAGHSILAAAPTVDERSRELLEHAGFRLDPRFAVKPVETLAIRDAWVVSRKADGAGAAQTGGKR